MICPFCRSGRCRECLEEQRHNRLTHNGDTRILQPKWVGVVLACSHWCDCQHKPAGVNWYFIAGDVIDGDNAEAKTTEASSRNTTEEIINIPG